MNRSQKFYDLPSTKSIRTTTFGYGDRNPFKCRNFSPPPGHYKSLSVFDKDQKKGKVYTFGICRDAYSKVLIQPSQGVDPIVPGPGSYDVRTVVGKDARKSALGPRTLLRDGPPRNIRTPGPGAYETLSGTTPKGTQFLSRFESSRASNFHPPHSKRFRDIRNKH